MIWIILCIAFLSSIDGNLCRKSGDNRPLYQKVTGRHGRAFLFSHAMNIVVGPKEDRNLTTGLHTVADISCADCQEVLGWKYERAYEASQKYKEGKFIFEKSKIVQENWNLSTNSDCQLSLVVHPCIVPCIRIRYKTPSFRLNGWKQMEKKLRTWQRLLAILWFPCLSELGVLEGSDADLISDVPMPPLVEYPQLPGLPPLFSFQTILQSLTDVWFGLSQLPYCFVAPLCRREFQAMKNIGCHGTVKSTVIRTESTRSCEGAVILSGHKSCNLLQLLRRIPIYYSLRNCQCRSMEHSAFDSTCIRHMVRTRKHGKYIIIHFSIFGDNRVSEASSPCSIHRLNGQLCISVLHLSSSSLRELSLHPPLFLMSEILISSTPPLHG
ncbi:hypothetical protein SADUNF_Sadunf12G0009200 [Salix dunnii]|uniref:Yippee domain-containing protein n=1 Tax=Salix dunnii TaxID=1413687 RepID=A0A835MMH9_9ROSI|nr:hypothetical protein SADUNF_Sadunf12G0009200 [Salix dunnii]